MKKTILVIHSDSGRGYLKLACVLGPVLAIAALAIPLQAQSLPKAKSSAASTLVIKNATLYVTPQRKLENATLIVSRGRVRGYGANPAIPKEAQVIDASGKVVTAGLVDSIARVGLVEIDMVDASVDGSFRGGAGVHASYSVLDGYNPQSITIGVARAGGVTSIGAVPEGGLIGGQSAWLSLGAKDKVDDLVLVSVVGMHITMGQQSARYGFSSRGAALSTIRELFRDAALYHRQRSRFERAQLQTLAASRSDLDALGTHLSKRRPLMIWANRASDIALALKLGSEYRSPVVIVGGDEAWMLSQELKEAKATVVTSPNRNLPKTFDSVHVSDFNISILQQNDVPVAISSLGEASNSRTLRQLAGISVSRGSSWDDALASVTTVPAKMLGDGNRGTLEKGQPADLVIWSGDPFELSSHAETMLIGGEQVSLDNHQTKLLQRYRDLEAQ